MSSTYQSHNSTEILAAHRVRWLQQKTFDISTAEAVVPAKQAYFEIPQRPSALHSIAQRRLAAGKLVAGVAAASSSDMFKGSVSQHPSLPQQFCTNTVY